MLIFKSSGKPASRYLYIRKQIQWKNDLNHNGRQLQPTHRHFSRLRLATWQPRLTNCRVRLANSSPTQAHSVAWRIFFFHPTNFGDQLLGSVWPICLTNFWHPSDQLVWQICVLHRTNLFDQFVASLWPICLTNVLRRLTNLPTNLFSQFVGSF